MIKMSLKQATTLLNTPTPAQDLIFEGISTDTRTVVPGNLFVAIPGAKFDGHNFLKEAQQKGAVAALVNRPLDCAMPQIQVTDTLLALGELAATWRNQFTLPLVGVTGSNGKTTLKNMLAAIFTAACHGNAAQVLATTGNFNNHIGLPLNLIRLNSSHRYGVIEMGMNHFGEIAYLTRLTQPHVAVITNAAAAHLEGVQDLAGVARAKGEIFQGLTATGVAILNRDDAFYDYWHQLTKKNQPISFGFHPAADVTAIHLNQPQINFKTPQGTFTLMLPLIGKHNIMNALAATAAALAVGLNLEVIKTGLEQVQPAPGRMNPHYLMNGACLIDDTYNANPFSTQAAIHSLAECLGTKILVLGDMRELGPKAKDYHAQTGEQAKACGIDYLFTLGELSLAATQAFGDAAQHYQDHQLLLTALQPYIKDNTTFLIKGSRSMHMEKIVAGLMQKNPTHEH